MKLNNKGFGAVEGFLILLILGIIGGVGFYVYSSNKKTNESLDNTGKSEVVKTNKPKDDADQAKPQPAAEDITKDWYEHKSANGIYNMKIPDGWDLGESTVHGGLAGFCTDDADCVTYKQGVRAQITKLQGGRGGPFRFNLQEGDAARAKSLMSRGTKAADIKAGDISVTKHVYVQTEQVEGVGLPKGAKEYSYLWIKGDKGVYISYSIYSPSDKDEVEYVEKAISTLR